MTPSGTNRSAVLIHSEATRLYLQARDHWLVHTVHGRVRASRLRVETIEGFDEAQLRGWASYQVSRARIDG